MGMSTFSHVIKQNGTDEWYTPKEAVELIAPYLKRAGHKRILCPFDKKTSEFVRVLVAKGFLVSYGHIETGEDFFELDNLQDYDAIVSNPPFSKKDKILQRLFDCGASFAMIMNFNGLFDSKTRWDLFSSNKFELLIPRGRIHFFGDNNKTNSPPFQSIYVCKGITDRQIEFIQC